MKRLISLLTALTLTLVLVSGVALAAPAQQGIDLDDVAALAAYAPEGTDVFAAIRTDDAYLDTWEALINRLAAQVGEEEVDLREMFDAESDMPYDMVRAVLGDSAAVYIPSLESVIMTGSDNLPVILAIEIVSPSIATALVEDNIFMDDYNVITLDDGSVLYEPNFEDDFINPPSYLITEDAFFMGEFGRGLANVVLPGADRRSLAQSENFNEALDAMPRDDYNVFGYADLSGTLELFGALLPLFTAELGVDFELDDLDLLTDGVGMLALGAVIVDDRAFVLDLVTSGDAFEGTADPVDLDLLDRVPDNTPLLIMGSGLGDGVTAALDAVELLNDLILLDDPEAFDEIAPFDLSSVATFLRFSFEGTYGVDFEDAMAALNGDFITYLTTGYNPEMSELFLGSNLLIATQDPEATTELVEAIAEILTDVLVPAVFADGVVTAPLGTIISMDELLTFSVAATDEIVIMGSEQDVAFALEPGDDSLTSTDAFAFESTLFLDEPTTLWYIDTEPLRALIRGLLADERVQDMLTPDDRFGLGSTEMALGLLTSSSITAGETDGGYALRLTLTLGE